MKTAVALLCLTSIAVAEPRLFTGGVIWTGDAKNPRAQAILIDGEKIVAVGSDADVRKLAHGARETKLGGRVVLPGLIDSHIHIMGGGLQLARVELSTAKSRKETLDAIVAWAKAHPTAPWILGRGWSYDLWKPGLPTRGELDAVLPDRPVFVRAYDGHSGWANSKALALAGITDATPDPKNGTIVREPGGKRPSGALLEEAMELVFAKVPQPSLAEKREAVKRALALAASHGLTALCEVGADLDDLDVFDALDRDHELALRVVYGPSIDDGVEKYAARRAKLLAEAGRTNLYPGPLKGFVDGVVESGTAHMLAAYADGQPSGATHIPPATLLDQVTRADKLGIDVAYHAVGDKAVRSVLDAVQTMEKANAPRERRFRVEHIEVVSPDDLSRFGRLGVIASVMPIHAEPSGELNDGIWSKKVGKARLAHAFAFHDLEQAGARLAFGSDWPVAPLGPLPAIAVAVTRQNAKGQPPGGWIGTQRISVDEALAGFTRGAAYATRLDGETGVLAPGKSADFVVLDGAAKLDDGRSFYDTHVESTWVRGRAVYEARERR